MSALTMSGSITMSGSMLAVSGNLSAPQKAIMPNPADAATRAALATTLSWDNGGAATSYDVYLDTVNPPVTQVATAQAGTTYAASLAYDTVYYWRVNPKNSAGTTTGDVWSFTSLIPIVADVYVDAENGTAGDALTTTILNNGTHTSAGTWSGLSVAGSANMKVSSGEKSLFTPAEVGVTVYTDAGSTRAFTADLSVLIQFASFTLTTPVDVISMGCWIKLDAVVAKQLDLIGIINSIGGAAVIQTDGTAGLALRCHTAGSGPSLFGDSISGLSVGTWYWVTMTATRHVDATLKVYSATGVLLGTSTCASTNTDVPWTFLTFGRSDNHTGIPQPNPGELITFDDILIDVTDATFPLGP